MHTTWPQFHSYGIRPDIRCTFSAMRQCDASFGRETKAADECRDGARDAHLLDYSLGRSEAYRFGRTATLVCPPSYDEAYARTPVHYATLHDPRQWGTANRGYGIGCTGGPSCRL